MIDALLALVYVPFGYAIAMLRYADKDLRAFEEGLRKGQEIAREDAEVSSTSE